MVVIEERTRRILELQRTEVKIRSRSCWDGNRKMRETVSGKVVLVSPVVNLVRLPFTLTVMSGTFRSVDTTFPLTNSWKTGSTTWTTATVCGQRKRIVYEGNTTIKLSRVLGLELESGTNSKPTVRVSVRVSFLLGG